MPYTMNDLDDVRIHYELSGVDGPPLVLYHDSAASAALWRHLGYVERLGEEYRVIAIDARGHGHSDKPDDEAAYSMRLFVADVLAVLDRTGVESASFFGYGMGGRVAYGLGLHAPERIDSLIIGSAFAPTLDAFERMTLPVLLFAGEHDERLHNSRIAADRLPNATLTVIPGENHATTIARVDKVLPHVLAFLARVTNHQAHAA